jgi:hypothetical protein
MNERIIINKGIIMAKGIKSNACACLNPGDI